jgi:hypothetical protein
VSRKQEGNCVGSTRLLQVVRCVQCDEELQRRRDVDLWGVQGSEGGGLWLGRGGL